MEAIAFCSKREWSTQTHTKTCPHLDKAIHIPLLHAMLHSANTYNYHIILSEIYLKAILLIDQCKDCVANLFGSSKVGIQHQ